MEDPYLCEEIILEIMLELLVLITTPRQQDGKNTVLKFL
jgi:hypothetical protein